VLPALAWQPNAVHLVHEPGMKALHGITGSFQRRPASWRAGRLRPAGRLTTLLTLRNLGGKWNGRHGRGYEDGRPAAERRRPRSEIRGDLGSVSLLLGLALGRQRRRVDGGIQGDPPGSPREETECQVKRSSPVSPI
jgi:hypothetical protein